MGSVFVSLVVGAVFLFLAFKNLSLAEIGAASGRFDARWLLPAIAISLLLQVFRAWRWQLELRPLERIGLGRLWIVTSVAYMAINVLPARLGEAVRPWLLSRRSGVSMSNVVGNLVIEKTMDSMVILLYILVGLLTTADLPEWVRRGAMVPAGMAGALVTLVILTWRRGDAFAERWSARVLPASVSPAVMGIVRAFVAGMAILPEPKLVLSVFLVSLGLWFLPILSSYILILAFGLPVPFNAALMVFIFIGFGTALPQAPGMIGTYQYACVLALGLFGVPQAEAVAYGLVLNAIQLVTLVAQGVVALLVGGVSLQEVAAAYRAPAAATSTR